MNATSLLGTTDASTAQTACIGRSDKLLLRVAVHTKKDAGRLGNRILREAGVE